MRNVQIPIAITEYNSRIFRPNLSTTSVDTYVDTTAIMPIIIVEVFDEIELPVACNN